MAILEDLRIRLVKKVSSGLSRRQAAAHFEVSASSAVRFVKQYEEEGTVALKPRAAYKRRLDRYGEDILRWIDQNTRYDTARAVRASAGHPCGEGAQIDP